jgi:hypothetical protein
MIQVPKFKWAAVFRLGMNRVVSLFGKKENKMLSKSVSTIVLVMAAFLVAAAISLSGAKATGPSGDSALRQQELKNGASAMDSWDFYLRHSGPVGIQYQRAVVVLTSDSAVKAPESASAMDSWDYSLLHSGPVGIQYERPLVALTSDSAAAAPVFASAMDSWDYSLLHSGPVGIQYLQPVVTLTGALAPTYIQPLVTLTGG